MGQKKETRYAVALKYRAGEDAAPKIAAKGRGRLAEKILEIARANNLHIHEDPDLIEVLSRLDLHEAIPPELYVVVAELLAFVYGMNRNFKP